MPYSLRYCEFYEFRAVQPPLRGQVQMTYLSDSTTFNYHRVRNDRNIVEIRYLEGHRDGWTHLVTVNLPPSITADGKPGRAYYVARGVNPEYKQPMYTLPYNRTNPDRAHRPVERRRHNNRPAPRPDEPPDDSDFPDLFGLDLSDPQG